MRFSFIDAKKVDSQSRAFAKLSKLARVAISLGKAVPPVKASARTWCCLLISGSVFACRGRLMEARACTLISLRMVSSPDATGLPG